MKQAAAHSRTSKALQVLMLLFKSFKDDGDQLNVAVSDEVRNLICGVGPVPPADTSCLLRLHVVLQLPVGGMNLLQKLRPTASMKSLSAFKLPYWL